MKTKWYFFNVAVYLPVLLLLFSLVFPSSSSAQKTYANSQTNQVNGVCLLCGVTSPNNPVNASSLDDYSTFVINVGLLGVSVEQTLIFPAASNAGCDSLVIGIGSSNTVLSANLFGGVTVETYNGTTANNDAKVVSSGILRLLDCNTRAEVLLRPTAQFDRVKIKLSSALLGLLTSFHLYYAYKKNSIANPVYSPQEGIVCGATPVLIQNHQEGVDYHIRIIYSGLSTIFLDTAYVVQNNDTVFLPPYDRFASAQGDIYIQAVNPVTGCKSDSVHHAYWAGSASALPNVDADSVHICQGDTATLHATQVLFNPLYSNVWYNAAAGGTLLYTGDIFKVSPATTTTYFVTGKAYCEYPSRRPVKVQVTPRTPPALVNNPLSVVLNTTDTLRAISPADAVFRWYNAPAGGTLLFTGSKLPVHPVTTDTLHYYVESVVDGCVSSRTHAIVVVTLTYGLADNKENMTGQLDFYPNPTTGQVWFKENKAFKNSMVVINSMDGIPVYQTILKTNSVQLPGSLPAGAYVIQLRTKTGKIYSGKVLISK